MLIKLFRIASFLEGLSYLYLLFCSIYLKRMKGIEDAIETPGMIHGALFVTFAFLLLNGLIYKKYSFLFSVLAFIASLLPFGFLWIEHKLKTNESDQNDDDVPRGTSCCGGGCC